MNATSDVVGAAKIQSGSEHAFLYSHGVLRDIGTGADRKSGANDINRSGQIVGAMDVGADDRHASLYADGKTTDLGVPGAFKYSVANGINDAGDIVGTAYSYTGGGFLWVSIDSRPYLYAQGRWEDLSAAVDLTGTDLDHLREAVRINNRGQIIGQAMGKGAYRGFLLTPMASPSPDLASSRP
jgi:probable HAF family extracellular repeat protein